MKAPPDASSGLVLKTPKAGFFAVKHDQVGFILWLQIPAGSI
jgi:hypothetical protein